MSKARLSGSFREQSRGGFGGDLVGEDKQTCSSHKYERAQLKITFDLLDDVKQDYNYRLSQFYKNNKNNIDPISMWASPCLN